MGRTGAVILTIALASALAACSLTSLDGLTCAAGSCPGDGTPDASGLSEGEAGAPPPPGPDVVPTLGDGHSGSKHIVSTESVNAFAALVSDVAASATTIDLDVAGPIADGDLVLVWQVTTDEPVVAAGTTKIDLAGSRAGLYELARVKHIARNGAGAHVELAAPLVHAFGAAGSQVVQVPEYTDLTIDGSGSLLAPPWDGRVGGIVAALVQGSLRVDGSIVVSALGARGGATFVNSGPYNCGTDDGLRKDGYAAKGEGLVRLAYQAPGSGDPAGLPGGRANATTGGGGGVCHNAGAGGGGNGSAGGQGGRDYDSNAVGRDVGGLGGVAITFGARDRLLFGGGGGAGDRHDVVDTTGARGGGVVFLRARDLVATGPIRADGAAAGATNHDGAGGGGAGGTIAITLTGTASCAVPIGASGGAGGSTTMSNVGPGGGGGGGHVMLAASASTCSFLVQSGVAGTQANNGAVPGKRYGATPAAPVPGIIETP